MRQVKVAPHLSVEDLERRYRRAQEPHERSSWQILWLLARGQTARQVAESTGYSAYWIGQLAQRYNTQGPEAMRNRQRFSAGGSYRRPMFLSAEQQEELRQALAGPPPGGAAGDLWTARAVADWMARTLGRAVATQRGWDYLQRLKQQPPGATATSRPGRSRGSKPPSKKAADRSSRAVACAFPQAHVELWALDEHRIGLKPLLRRVWAPIGQRPTAAVSAPLRLALPGRLCPSRLGPDRLSSGDHRQHPRV